MEKIMLIFVPEVNLFWHTESESYVYFPKKQLIEILKVYGDYIFV